MDEYTADAFANRDEPVQFLAVSPTEANPEANAEGRRQKLKRALSPSRLKTKPVDINTTPPEKDDPPATPSLRASIQDRLFSSLLRQVVPTDESDDIISPTPM